MASVLRMISKGFVLELLLVPLVLLPDVVLVLDVVESVLEVEAEEESA